MWKMQSGCHLQTVVLVKGRKDQFEERQNVQVQGAGIKQLHKLTTGGTSSLRVCISTWMWSIKERSELLHLGQEAMFPLLLINQSCSYFSPASASQAHAHQPLLAFVSTWPPGGQPWEMAALASNT